MKPLFRLMTFFYVHSMLKEFLFKLYYTIDIKCAD